MSMMVFALCVSGAVKADEKTVSVNAQRFEAIKSLAGDWVEVKNGKPTDKVVSSIRVTAGGNTVQETLFPGSEHEMVTMYHLDGADLVLTHYCMLGNQPRMKAEPGNDVNKIAFKFAGITNLKAPEDQHIHDATIAIQDKDHFHAVWASCKDGKACHEVKLDLVRKQK
jgi:hypothetical protein